ncbi:mechanosensitive ion channel family protein [Halobacterium zhouii]|uniref:mechanosensitive ion channel family protein n=1 Tax=Halobacterium zhouii TaxID=2902624 RepID=UPI001E5CB1B0|nr:hypothetical protein [Halobacterium zhouii]
MNLHNALSSIVLQEEGPFDAIPEFLQETVQSIIAFLPRLVGAIVILIIGWIIGAILGGIVKRITDSVGLDAHATDTPLGRMSSGDDPVSTLLGKITAWFVYALAILAAADALAIEILSEWLARAVSYLPAFIAGLLVIIVGFVVADIIGDVIRSSLGSTAKSSWFADGVRMFLYFTAIVIGFDTMGIDIELLYIFARALAWGLAIGIGAAIAIAFGWGAKDYVSNNISQWAGKAKQQSPSPDSEQRSGGDD